MSALFLFAATYPGAAKELFRPILERGSGLEAGRDSRLGHGPERIVVPVSSTWPAKLATVLKDTFRHVNIALNELAIVTGDIGLDAREVVRVAATRLFGFMPLHSRLVGERVEAV